MPIETAKHNVTVTANAILTILYRQIGNRIRQDILEEKRAEYGKEIVATLSQQLSWNNFYAEMRFAEYFKRFQMLCEKLANNCIGWSNIG
ncbi:MAG: DUF1016 N-terminal domain-containing protein [Deltaproteobacteria bacterium]|nr:DUF1016 N-terminal domain-containing protein [Deltaproteobacteria bacterium]